MKYTHKTYRIGHEWTFQGEPVTTMLPVNHELTERMIEAMAKAMMQTKEIVAANVFHRGSPETDH